MNQTVVKLPVASLIEDSAIYPRHAVDDNNIGKLTDSLRAGVELPPVIAAEEQKIIIDGWHRCRAHIRVFGLDAEVAVELRDYASRAEMLADAVRLNAAHGLQIQGVDRVRCVKLLEAHGYEIRQIAGILSVPPATVKRYVVRVAPAEAAVAGGIPGSKLVPLKRSVAHLAGQTLNRAQADAMSSMPGVSFSLLVRQLTLGLREGLLDMTNETLIAALTELRELLVQRLG